ncbi:MAG: hypothetical protein O7D32_09525 [bacterium]|nr:hypothetical protein [bacterium]
MKRTRILAVALTAAVAWPSLVSAQAGRNTKEWVQDNAQIISGKATFDRDRKEITAFAALLAELDVSSKARHVARIDQIRADLRVAMQRERNQARRKTSQAGREVRQSRREARGEWQEAAATGRLVDHLQLADDRRDLRDDKRDRRHVAVRVKRMSDIINASDALKGAIRGGGEAAFVKDRRLLGEFLMLMRADLRATSVELAEDRRERREDRRERRTDRNK